MEYVIRTLPTAFIEDLFVYSHLVPRRRFYRTLLMKYESSTENVLHFIIKGPSY
jgi:hypothetical protein